MSVVHFAVEGWTDIPVAKRLIRLVGRQPKQVFVAGGKSRLDPQVTKILRTSGRLDWLILRDLDDDAPCAAALVAHLTDGQSLRRVHLRIAVRASESWLLADARAFAGEFSISIHDLPSQPDELVNPKRSVVELCRRSRRAEIRDAMIPRSAGGRAVGPEYATRISAFAREKWDPERAASRSPSLSRTLSALRRTAAKGGWTPTAQ